MLFKENVRNELLYKDIQIKELAGKINVPYSTVLSYLGEKSRLPRVDIAVKIAQALDVSVEYLVTGNEQKNYMQGSFIKDFNNLPDKIQITLLELIHHFSEI